jgi:TrmH family RNA methyltransferase
MANFGFSRLAVVAPFEAHWREAKSAVGAEGLLKEAKCTERLAEAVADCTLVVGTGTLDRRKAEQRVVSLRDLGPRIGAELKRCGRVALVFGQEKRGLTRENLALCHLLATIPTDERQPSMNLGQAVAVCLYELARGESRPDTVQDPRAESATAGELELLAKLVAEAMAAANYSPAAMKKVNRHGVQLLLRRLHLNSHDARRVLGLFRRILWKLKV